MKKLLVLLCTFALAATACGKEEPEVNTPEVTETPVSDTSEDTTTNQDVADEKVVNLDDYVGHYTDENLDEVTISKNDDNYSMTVELYRLASFDEGEVSASSEGVIFKTIDPSGNPLELSFCNDSDDSYSIKIIDSTWEYLENDTVYSDFATASEDEDEPTASSDLDDGSYFTNLLTEPAQYMPEYLTSFELKADCIVVDASFSRVENGDYSNKTNFEKKQYTIAIDSNTKFLSGGGEEAPTNMSAAEFGDYIKLCMGSGLGLDITIENGVATEIGIWS
ncbi:MAG: hypothetical protein K5883_04430 [Pseudobutyrivibrio sp.]|nr:hypothetical protein [Pseudobutyrivibrio sp.]